MAKAVKVYRGSVADTPTTIYTVPAGRVAKVTWSYLLSSSAGGTIALTAGGQTLFSQTLLSGAVGGFPASARKEATSVGSSMLLSDNALIAGQFQSTSNNTVDANTFQVVPRDVYLVAGDTVTVRFGNYSFVVVEEY